MNERSQLSPFKKGKIYEHLPSEERHFRGCYERPMDQETLRLCYIVGEDGDNYLYFELTKDPRKGESPGYYKMHQNPIPGDNDPIYLKEDLDSYPKHLFTVPL